MYVIGYRDVKFLIDAVVIVVDITRIRDSHACNSEDGEADMGKESVFCLP